MSSAKDAVGLDMDDCLDVSSEEDSILKNPIKIDIDDDVLASAIAECYGLGEVSDEEKSPTCISNAETVTDSVTAEAESPKGKNRKRRRGGRGKRKKPIITVKDSADEVIDGVLSEYKGQHHSTVQHSQKVISNTITAAEFDAFFGPTLEQNKDEKVYNITESDKKNTETKDIAQTQSKVKLKKEKKPLVVEGLKKSFDEMKLTDNFSGSSSLVTQKDSVSDKLDRNRFQQDVAKEHSRCENSHPMLPQNKNNRRKDGEKSSGLVKQNEAKKSPARNIGRIAEEKAVPSSPKNSYSKLLMEHRRKGSKVKDIRYINTSACEYNLNRRCDPRNKSSQVQYYSDHNVQGMLNSSDYQNLHALTEEFEHLKRKDTPKPPSSVVFSADRKLLGMLNSSDQRYVQSLTEEFDKLKKKDTSMTSSPACSTDKKLQGMLNSTDQRCTQSLTEELKQLKQKDTAKSLSQSGSYADKKLQGMLNSDDQQSVQSLSREFQQLLSKNEEKSNSMSMKCTNNKALPKVYSQTETSQKEVGSPQLIKSSQFIATKSDPILAEENKKSGQKSRSKNRKKRLNSADEDSGTQKQNTKTDPQQNSTVDKNSRKDSTVLSDKPRSELSDKQDSTKKKSNKDVKRNRNKNASTKQPMFEPYMDMYGVTERLKRGQLIQGPIRINPKNFEEAYVPLPDGTADIFINGLKDRNRALNGDIVAVQLCERDSWRVYTEEVEAYEKNMCRNVLPKEDTTETDSDPDVIIEDDDETGDSSQFSSVKLESRNNAVSCSNATPEKQKTNTPTKKIPGNNGAEKREPGSAKKKHTILKDMKAGGSPAVQKLFKKTEISDKYLQCTGKVVAIIEKIHSRACTGNIKLLKDKNPDKALFAPNDHRLPRINIAMADCPKDFLERADDYSNTLFVARITDWKENSVYAIGHLARSLGEAGQIEPETEGMLIEYDVDSSEFPEEVLECLPKGSPWKIPPEEYQKRRNFTRNCVFTIDPATARDLDDALSCEEIGNGVYEVGVHIADVSYFLHEDTDLDKIASGRATSVYLVQKVIPMLPRLLCEQLCSLNPDEERLTFSVVWKMTEKGEILEEWFGRSIIKSCVKLSYDHAQGFIEQPERTWTAEELPPISAPFTIANITERVLNFHKIAQNLRKFRFDNGALRLDQVKLQYSLDKETGLPNGYSVYLQRESNRLVEEFMLLANMAVAHKIKEAFPATALLRRHPPPQNKMIDELEELCAGLGVPLDCSSSGTIQQSLQQCYGTDEYSRGRLQVLVSLCSKPMQMAKYFAVGSIEDETMFHHYALSVPLYTHFTSPIRRYADVIVHRHLAAALGYCPEINKTTLQVQRQAEICNLKKTNSKKVQELSQELFFAVFVKEAGPFEEKGMVMGVMDKAFDVFIMELGVAKRVYVDKLNLKEHEFHKEQKCPTLTLIWNTDEDCREEIVQKITIFTTVHCVLSAGKEPLRWTAVIKRPQL